ncbi:MAG: oxidoreductase [Solirubrobacteraceae bacterium MAG38_C4-C5]|nr:oxidoreductase [Candidatus Siliceabacter maunaloa]
MAGWTTTQIPPQGDRTVLVTGANSGLGLITARELARAGARVIVAVRDTSRGVEAAGEIRRVAPGAVVEVERLDLGDLASVRACAEAVSERHERLHLLVNNAGVMAPPRRETVDGFELQLGTNHLGHFALTGLLLDRLLGASEPRVVTVSSAAHRMGKMDFDDLQAQRGYSAWPRYGQSKLANLLFCFELQRRAAAAGVTLRSMAAHPGYAATNLQTSGPLLGSGGPIALVKGLAMRAGNLVAAQSAEKGALPTLYAATVPDLPGAAYIGPDGRGEMRGSPTPVGTSDAALDEESARRLWQVSEELTGVAYEAL